MTNHLRLAGLAGVLAAVAVALAGPLLAAAPASAHGFNSTAYVDLAAGAPGHVLATVELEYDLLVVSAAEKASDPSFFDEGMAVFQTGDEATALRAHEKAVLSYIDQHLGLTADGVACVETPATALTSHVRDEVPYAQAVLDYDCTGGGPAASASGPVEHTVHQISSSLFPDSEGYVTDTKTIVSYDLDGQAGSAALDAANPSFSTAQPWTDRFAEFFLLGAEHLLSGIDHILFLLALIVGSRRLRDVVLAATTFTVAHSVTFLLAALGVVSVPPAIVEPIIALSIAVVAAWYLVTTWRKRPYVFTTFQPERSGLLGMERADWARLAVVFCFGLVHGLGFAGALGIDEPWSWTLLWSLLVFNVGIELVQLTIIAIVFPVLLLLRRRAPRVGLWVGVAIAAGVTLVGLVWFVQRILGIG
ncbi:HupE/UreJ family protein [Herbiconiux sp. 11R-BC]|uniref:HupE/UreJ family protein n=1 Tax=Herbiconiux sp. 11R-BC TaxID=3111637 RepID=UPI003C0D88B8